MKENRWLDFWSWEFDVNTLIGLNLKKNKKNIRGLSILFISKFFLVHTEGTGFYTRQVQDKTETKGVVTETRGQEGRWPQGYLDT